jgi:hypothetical protein
VEHQEAKLIQVYMVRLSNATSNPIKSTILQSNSTRFATRWPFSPLSIRPPGTSCTSWNDIQSIRNPVQLHSLSKRIAIYLANFTVHTFTSLARTSINSRIRTPMYLSSVSCLISCIPQSYTPFPSPFRSFFKSLRHSFT